MSQGTLGHVVQSGERGRTGCHTAWSPGSPLSPIRSDCGPVTPLSRPSFPYNKVEELARLIVEVHARSKILRFSPLMFQA